MPMNGQQLTQLRNSSRAGIHRDTTPRSEINRREIDMSILNDEPVALEEEYEPTGNDKDDVWDDPDDADIWRLEEELTSGELGDYQDEGVYLDSEDYPRGDYDYELSDPYDIEYDRP